MGFEWNKTTGAITVTRGDSGRRKLLLRMDGVPYEMQDGDHIDFGVKMDYEDTNCLIKKTFTENPFIFALNPEDTKDMDFDTYVYDMQFVAANGYTVTFYPKKSFKITEEVA